MDQRFPTLEALLNNPLIQGPLLLGVSGGGDSMALALAVRDLATVRGRSYQAAIVDHGLRAESGDESHAVAHRLSGFGVPAVVLPWLGAKPETGIQEAARTARHDLLAMEARRIGARCIVFAHTIEDQAETVAFRIARGSGVLGLSALATLAPSPARGAGRGVLVARPLLTETREGLRDYLRARVVAWIEDPSNTNDRFARVRIRQRLGALQKAGFDPIRLAKIGEHAAMLRQALNVHSIALSRASLRWVTGWEVQLNGEAIHDAEPSIAANLLRGVAYALGNAERVPSLAAGQRLLTSLKETNGATLGGTAFSRRRDWIRAARMPPRGKAAVPSKDNEAFARFAAALDNLPEWLRLNKLQGLTEFQIDR